MRDTSSRSLYSYLCLKLIENPSILLAFVLNTNMLPSDVSGIEGICSKINYKFKGMSNSVLVNFSGERG